MKDRKTKERFIELRAAGVSYAKIAAELCVSKQTLITWSKDLTQQISNLREVEWEALCDKHLVAKEQRVRLLGTLLEKIVEEAKARELGNVPTDKLFGLLLKYSLSLKNEESKLTFKREDPLGMFASPETWTP